MNHRFIVILLGLFIITTVVGGVVYFEKTGIPLPTVGPPPAEPAEPTAVTPGFQITSRTTEEIEGVFNKGSSTVKFKSRMESPTQVSVQVQVNDLVLDASAELGEDGKKKVVIIDGHGKALSPEDKRALIALNYELERYLHPFSQPQNIRPHEDLLVRTEGYWAEAPVGFPLERQEVLSPKNQ